MKQAKVKQLRKKSPKNEIESVIRTHQRRPLVLAYIDDKNGINCFAGQFTVEQICVLKETINRKLDSMIGQAIKFGAEAENEIENILNNLPKQEKQPTQ